VEARRTQAGHRLDRQLPHWLIAIIGACAAPAIYIGAVEIRQRPEAVTDRALPHARPRAVSPNGCCPSVRTSPPGAPAPLWGGRNLRLNVNSRRYPTLVMRKRLVRPCGGRSRRACASCRQGGRGWTRRESLNAMVQTVPAYGRFEARWVCANVGRAENAAQVRPL
jgi:hypothetical protein